MLSGRVKQPIPGTPPYRPHVKRPRLFSYCLPCSKTSNTVECSRRRWEGFLGCRAPLYDRDHDSDSDSDSDYLGCVVIWRVSVYLSELEQTNYRLVGAIKIFQKLYNVGGRNGLQSRLSSNDHNLGARLKPSYFLLQYLYIITTSLTLSD